MARDAVREIGRQTLRLMTRCAWRVGMTTEQRDSVLGVVGGIEGSSRERLRIVATRAVCRVRQKQRRSSVRTLVARGASANRSGTRSDVGHPVDVARRTRHIRVCIQQREPRVIEARGVRERTLLPVTPLAEHAEVPVVLVVMARRASGAQTQEATLAGGQAGGVGGRMTRHTVELVVAAAERQRASRVTRVVERRAGRDPGRIERRIADERHIRPMVLDVAARARRCVAAQTTVDAVTTLQLPQDRLVTRAAGLHPVRLVLVMTSLAVLETRDLRVARMQRTGRRALRLVYGVRDHGRERERRDGSSAPPHGLRTSGKPLESAAGHRSDQRSSA